MSGANEARLLSRITGRDIAVPDAVGGKRYDGKGDACQSLLKFDASLASIQRRFDSMIIARMLEFAKESEDFSRNGGSRERCKYRSSSTYGSVNLVGKNRLVCDHYKKAMRLSSERDAAMAPAVEEEKGFIKKHLKHVVPDYFRKGWIKVK